MAQSMQSYFSQVVKTVLNKTNMSALITIENHETIKGHEEALGIAHFDWDESKSKYIFERITIDEYFVKECYNEHFNVTPQAHYMRELAGDTLEGVLCHELAHVKHRIHTKAHARETARLLALL